MPRPAPFVVLVLLPALLLLTLAGGAVAQESYDPDGADYATTTKKPTVRTPASQQGLEARLRQAGRP